MVSSVILYKVIANICYQISPLINSYIRLGSQAKPVFSSFLAATIRYNN